MSADAVRAVSRRWLDALAASDAEGLRDLVTEDVVVVHGDGRVVSGCDAVVADFADAFRRYRVTQTLIPQETIVTGEWAFDRTRAVTRIVDLATGGIREVGSHAVTVLRRSERGDWRVARVLGVVERTP